MGLYQNTSSETRSWADLTYQGHTLELEPGATVELELGEDFDDAWLKLVDYPPPADAVPPAEVPDESPVPEPAPEAPATEE